MVSTRRGTLSGTKLITVAPRPTPTPEPVAPIEVEPATPPEEERPTQVSTSSLKVQIQTPVDRQKVPHNCPIKGTYSGEHDKNKTYRVVTYPYSTGNYHPQGSVIQFTPYRGSKTAGGTLKGTAYVGPALGGAGEVFKIYIVAASAEADREFTEYIKTAARDGYPGMDDLPVGADPVVIIEDVVR
jgi:hypothetical protein